MIIDYVVTHTTVLDPFHIRVVVDIRTPRVINGYGGGCITINVPLVNHRTAIEAAVMKKFTREVSPQEHDLVLNGDCTKAELVQEELGLAAAQRRERSRELEQLERFVETEGASEGEQEPAQSLEVADREDARNEETQEATPAVVEDGQADVSSVVEESPKE